MKAVPARLQEAIHRHCIAQVRAYGPLNHRPTTNALPQDTGIIPKGLDR